MPDDTTKRALNPGYYDLLIAGGTVYDGLGNPGQKLDVALRGDLIVEIGPRLDRSSAREVISVEGMAVSPGFIDPHSHTDIELLVNPLAESKIRQGVTTEIAGNCGFTVFPLNERSFSEKKRYLMQKYGIELTWNDVQGFFGRLEENGLALNYASLLGHGALRESVVGPHNRVASPDELAKMKKIVGDNIKAGIMGLSTGLIYTPGIFAQVQEIIELCRVVADMGGVYATHMRDEGDYLIEAVEEAIRVAVEAGVSLQISHLKLSYPRNWSKLHAVLSRISEMRSEGVEILADRYPYTATSTFLSVFFPCWIKEGSASEYLRRLNDVRLEKELRAYVKKQEEKIGSWSTILICSVLTEKNKSLVGKNILQAASESGKEPFEFIRDLLIEEQDQVGMINFSLNEENFKRIMAHPLVVIGSDGWALAPYGKLGVDKPHPRSYGTFPRLLGRYVREEKIMSLGHAIEKMTSIAARKFGLDKRGQIREGFFADLVVFDPDRVIDLSTWDKPHQYPAGIEYVIVNGEVVIRRGEHTGLLPGRILKH